MWCCAKKIKIKNEVIHLQLLAKLRHFQVHFRKSKSTQVSVGETVYLQVEKGEIRFNNNPRIFHTYKVNDSKQIGSVFLHLDLFFFFNYSTEGFYIKLKASPVSRSRRSQKYIFKTSFIRPFDARWVL